jgi:predicted transcriptional regulator YdeE
MEAMNVKFVDKPSFTVIGKLGQGEAKKSAEWLPPLWQAANGSFAEISDLAKRDDAGNLVGLWGAMSDIGETFAVWNEQGKYLAGCEVEDGAEAPENWTKWVVPGSKYAVAACTQADYFDVFFNTKTYLAQAGMPIVGAVHEFYDPKDTGGEIYLYFPVARL